MSGNHRPPSTLRSWLQEEAATTRHPSWIAPKRRSSRPPAEVTPPPPAEAHAVAEAPTEEDPCISSERASVELAMSVEIASLKEQNVALRSQLAEMAAAMARLRREVLESSEIELVRLATAIAERVVGRELALAPDLVVDWAKEAIQLLAAKDEVVIAIARDVAQQVPAEAWRGLDLDSKVQMDALLAEGSVEVRTAEGAVLSGAAARLKAVSQALGVTEDE